MKCYYMCAKKKGERGVTGNLLSKERVIPLVSLISSIHLSISAHSCLSQPSPANLWWQMLIILHALFPGSGLSSHLKWIRTHLEPPCKKIRFLEEFLMLSPNTVFKFCTDISSPFAIYCTLDVVFFGYFFFSKCPDFF